MLVKDVFSRLSDNDNYSFSFHTSMCHIGNVSSLENANSILLNAECLRWYPIIDTINGFNSFITFIIIVPDSVYDLL